MPRIIDADPLIVEIDNAIIEALARNDVATLQIANLFREIIEKQPTMFFAIKPEESPCANCKTQYGMANSKDVHTCHEKCEKIRPIFRADGN